ncbi:protein male-specific lethal-1 [Musca vetustissima]|uniref:protein male-specific lethal-1 n=1 Tax=Musca vetustissima TaxID=27455 RepID=UPI002AB71D94|nr:protein male-specific lethal-1 [Musca vetustissima]
MEGKCNKAPTSKYLDHVYCHPTQTKSVYSNNMATAGSSGGGSSSTNADVLALLKENKQLKGMLILHLDLIQEQSDQLMALRARNNALENTIQELQKQLQQQKRSAEMPTLPLPPLAKIQPGIGGNAPALAQSTNAKQTTSGSQVISNIIGVCNGKLINKIVLSSVRGKQRTQSPQSQTTDSEHEDDDEEEREPFDDVDIEEIIDDEDIEEDPSINGQDNCENEEDRAETANENKAQEDISMQQHIIDDMYDTGNSTEDSNEVLAVQSKRLRLKQAAKQSLVLPRGAKPSVSPASTTTSDGQTTFKAVTSVNTGNVSVSRGKQMTIMRWHAPDYHTDESVSCDSTAETEKRSASVASCSPPKPSAVISANEKKRYNHGGHDSQHTHVRTKIRKCSYISTPQLYSTREWEDEPFHFDYDSEVIKSSETEKLEIPKWTEHELTPSYCIEGTEDLSDDTFFKRHAKLEVDEKRRKKWDVQQIREQRRIERLKRRHCKDEIQNVQESVSLQSFYPTTENLQSICYVQDLPVQAFGEMIPKILGTSGDRREFNLPWLERAQMQNSTDNASKKPTVTTLSCSAETNTSTQIQNQLLNSSFVMLKKRRRQQSSTFGASSHHSSTRQRSSATTKLAFTSTSSVPSMHNTTAVTTTTQAILSSSSTTVTITTTQCTSNSNSKP